MRRSLGCSPSARAAGRSATLAIPDCRLWACTWSTRVERECPIARATVERRLAGHPAQARERVTQRVHVERPHAGALHELQPDVPADVRRVQGLSGAAGKDQVRSSAFPPVGSLCAARSRTTHPESATVRFPASVFRRWGFARRLGWRGLPAHRSDFWDAGNIT
jgi:hypothetical protein